MVEFERHRPDNIPELAKNWLYAASKRTGISFLNADEYIKNCDKKEIHIYTITDRDALKACFCVVFHLDGKIMSLVLLGGEDVKSWRDEFVEFLFATAKKNGAVQFTMMGPLAWGKLFPELKLMSCVFGINLTNEKETVE